MLTITLPERLASTHLLAGIEFTDGVATVNRLGSHARRFLELTGATVSENAPTPVVENPEAIAALQSDGKLLTDCTVTELRDLADMEGIDLPAKATKPQILSAFLTAFTAEE